MFPARSQVMLMGEHPPRSSSGSAERGARPGRCGIPGSHYVLAPVRVHPRLIQPDLGRDMQTGGLRNRSTLGSSAPLSGVLRFGASRPVPRVRRLGRGGERRESGRPSGQDQAPSRKTAARRRGFHPRLPLAPSSSRPDGRCGGLRYPLVGSCPSLSYQGTQLNRFIYLYFLPG
jgi:hypothetical protein